MLAIPYTHSGVLSSSLAMQKDRAKDVMKAAGIPVADGLTMHRLEAAKGHPMPPPYVHKAGQRRLVRRRAHRQRRS